MTREDRVASMCTSQDEPGGTTRKTGDNPENQATDAGFICSKIVKKSTTRNTARFTGLVTAVK